MRRRCKDRHGELEEANVDCGSCEGFVMPGNQSEWLLRLGRKCAWVVHYYWTWRKTVTARKKVPGGQGVWAQAQLQVPRMHQARRSHDVEKKGVCLCYDTIDPCVSVACST